MPKGGSQRVCWAVVHFALKRPQEGAWPTSYEKCTQEGQTQEGLAGFGLYEVNFTVCQEG